MKILVTGSAGFIGGYIVEELLSKGYSVRGIDNYSKYGKVARHYDTHPEYEFIEGDCKDTSLMTEILEECDQVVAGAAMIGGITYFHEHAYDLLAENERILASTFDAAISGYKKKSLAKINVLSSSMVFENSCIYPTPEGSELTSPPPHSTYGFQKLAVEYFARGALMQYGLPYTIIRPFNCIGVGESRALTDKEVMSGNVRLAMSHVLPDLAQKAIKGQKPLRILGDGNQVRHYTHGRDLARGIRYCIESNKALNEDFNLSTDRSTTVLELARLVWREVNGDEPFAYECDKPFEFDVQKRIPDTSKATRVLGFETQAALEESVAEVVAWVRAQVQAGLM